MSDHEARSDASLWNLRAVCAALTRYVEGGGRIRFESDRRADALTITFTLHDADRYHTHLRRSMASRSRAKRSPAPPALDGAPAGRG